ncbi:heme oxygenase [Ilumatobacter fluminis]|uniref:Heme oxygenase n=1 Tax=Ilumatobacter fluminis TaxID=467091 RepID=A0A4R7I0R9_9ACTN|nr:biliverdin-producing heme oxygenase [Ilumatobacter fluminis]TDT17122.1 heme oxygenase [Ilumatobacter fluminis]
MVDGRNHPRSDRATEPLGALRRAVDDLHQAVDERSSLGTAGLDVHRYGSSLVALARVLPGVEQALVRYGDGRFPFVPLTPLLVADVRSLGLDIDLEIDDSARSTESVGYDDGGSWWGAMYVMQGSRLGSTVIAERLAVDLPDVPRSYFDAAATDARPAWAAFRVAARAAFDGGQADLDRAVHSARAVFDALLVELVRADEPVVREGVAT